MRKVFAILLLSLLCFNLLGYQLFFYFQKSEARKEMKAYLRSKQGAKEIVTLKFSEDQAASLNWEDEEEFEWQGQMFDVIQKETSNGLLTIRCVSDRKESELVRSFINTTRKSSDSKQQAISKIVATVFLLPQSYLITEKPDNIRPDFPRLSFRILTVPLSVQSPPPQLLPC